MKQAILNRLVMLRGDVAAEVDSNDPAIRRWVEVIPQPEGGFVIYAFGVPVGLDTTRHLAPDTFVNESSSRFDTVDETLRALEQMGIDTDAFDVPWAGDFPM